MQTEYADSGGTPLEVFRFRYHLQDGYDEAGEFRGTLAEAMTHGAAMPSGDALELWRGREILAAWYRDGSVLEYRDCRPYATRLRGTT